MGVILAALIFGCCQALVVACSMGAGHFWFQHQKRKIRRELEEWARALIEAPDDQTPSPLAALIDQGALLLAARLMQQIKAMLAGVESGEAKHVQMQLFEQAAGSSPIVGIIGAMLPRRVRNALMKNPQMIGALSKLGGNHTGGGAEAPILPRRHRE